MPATFNASTARTALLRRVIRDVIRTNGVHGFGLIADCMKRMVEDLIAAEAERHGDETDLHAALEGVLGAIEQVAAEADMAGEI